MFLRSAIFCICIALFLSCSSRGEIALSPSKYHDGNIETVFFATTRQHSDKPYDFNDLRTSVISYGQYDVSIPSNHETGKIEYPSDPPDPRTSFVISKATAYENHNAFQTAIRQSNNKHENKGEAVVFIHGFNNTFAESVYRFAQIIHDMDVGGTPILYSWPSTDSSIEYLHDRDSILFARDGLETLLKDIIASGTKQILLVAHSIGANLLMETLRQMAIAGDRQLPRVLDGVVLIAPDIDENLFELQLQRLKSIPQPFIVFSDEKDLALKFSSLLTGKRNRLGQITNKEKFEKYGINIVNLSDFNDGNSPFNHDVALTSPSVISILKKLPAAAELTSQQGGNPNTLLQTLFTQ